ncbi:uncharacterized protein [Oscarella lobularis]|uniref:uncharacterized protein isoform X3 n=1 Tax=Oscarella lobularis TaxID=121494 RepID=UPI003313505B
MARRHLQVALLIALSCVALASSTTRICGQYNKKKGTIISLQSKAFCRYIIKPRVVGRAVRLHFRLFALSSDCRRHYVRLSLDDGASWSRPYCGSELRDATRTSCVGAMQIEFRTDSISGRFIADYVAVELGSSDCGVKVGKCPLDTSLQSAKRCIGTGHDDSCPGYMKCCANKCVNPVFDFQKPVKLSRSLKSSFLSLAEGKRIVGGRSGQIGSYQCASICLHLLIDRSGSIGFQHFERMLNFLKVLVKSLCARTPLLKVSAVTYASDVTHEIPCEKYQCGAGLYEAIGRIRYTKGFTHLDSAIDFVHKTMQKKRDGKCCNRDCNCKKVVFILTDGKSNGPRNPVSLARRLERETESTIFTFGVTPSVNGSELNAVATQNIDYVRGVAVNRNVFRLEAFNEFSRLAELLGALPRGPTCASDEPLDPCRRSDCAHTCTRNGDSSFLCSCERGFSLASDRRSCQRIDPCDQAGCSHRCIANGFIATCACNQGFALRADKKSCSRVNPCDQAGCAHRCISNGATFTCACNAGFRLGTDRKSCSRVNPCHQSGCAHRCIVRGSTFVCLCHGGFQLGADRKSCSRVSPCLQAKCAHRCTVTGTSFVCSCNRGFTLGADRRSCHRVDPCDEAGCAHRCSSSGVGFTCACNAGFRLGADKKSCSRVANPCDQAGCAHRCTPNGATFTCACNTGFSLGTDRRSCRRVSASCTIDNQPGQCRIRKDFLSMTSQERVRFVNAFKRISTRSPHKTIYNRLVRIHEREFRNGIHGVAQFLPWHRWFVLSIENLLRCVDPRVTIPYWDYSYVCRSPWQPLVSCIDDMWANNGRSLGGDGRGASDYNVTSGPFAYPRWRLTPSAKTSALRRAFQSRDLPCKPSIDRFMGIRCSAGAIRDVDAALAGPLHSPVHLGVNGTMRGESSANAPEFFLLHSFLDKLWSDWQAKGADCSNQYTGARGTVLTGTEGVTIDDVHRIARMSVDGARVCVRYERASHCLARQVDQRVGSTPAGEIDALPGTALSEVEAAFTGRRRADVQRMMRVDEMLRGEGRVGSRSPLDRWTHVERVVGMKLY